MFDLRWITGKLTVESVNFWRVSLFFVIVVVIVIVIVVVGCFLFFFFLLLLRLLLSFIILVCVPSTLIVSAFWRFSFLLLSLLLFHDHFHSRMPMPSSNTCPWSMLYEAQLQLRIHPVGSIQRKSFNVEECRRGVTISPQQWESKQQILLDQLCKQHISPPYSQLDTFTL